MDTPVPIPNTEVKHRSGENISLRQDSEPPGFFYILINLLFIYNKLTEINIMEINVIRLRTVLDDREKDIIKENDAFIDAINDELIDDDLLLVEDSLHAAFDIYFIETGGSETKFLEQFENVKAPVVLLSNGKNNSLPASLEIKSYCALHDIPAVILTGDEKKIATILKPFARAIVAKRSLEGNKLGLIGEPSDWLIASTVSDEDVKNIFNIDLVHVSMDEFKTEIDKHEMVKIPHLNDLKAKFKDEQVLEGALYIYSALKRLIAKYDLNGITVRCFDLLGIYKNTACLALALLNEEGITAGCEGDVPSMLTMHLLRALTGRSSFQANPSYIDHDKNSVIFAHCTLPLNMTNDYSLTTHFESGLGIGIKGSLHLGEVSICKIFINQKHNLDNCIAINGKIKENLSLACYCRTQINVELSDYDLMSILREDYGNHMVIVYGNVTDEFYTLISIFNFEANKLNK